MDNIRIQQRCEESLEYNIVQYKNWLSTCKRSYAILKIPEGSSKRRTNSTSCPRDTEELSRVEISSQKKHL
ncbi:hypothetical protein WN51_06563 [Melipona quadrifasciata]|uniref:Uncharacterized protein n=1 Tax=Melipona quadrifasciata TaxID=166423 RepID=A0A0M8ZU00_9HYME|nr:hypothetical protein WN51_06563 [Melipona quadrifasciata]